MKSLPMLLSEAARIDSDAFAESSRTLSYAEWDELSDRICAGIQSVGIKPGSVVALHLPNGIDYAITYLGVVKAGCIATGINQRYGSSEMNAILTGSGASIVVSDRDHSTPTITPSELITAGSDVRPRIIEPQPDDPVAIVYTSGTTGLPKGATYTARSIDAVTNIELSLDETPYPRSLGALPMPHMNFMTKVGYFIARRGFMVFTEGRWSARGSLEAIEKYRLTSIGGIPTQVSLMLMDETFDKRDLSSLRTLTLGGAPCSPELAREARERFEVPVLVRYSCTEVGLATGTNASDKDEVVARTVGRPLPGVSLRITDSGEISIRSPAMMRGYWSSDATGLDEDGYFHTGDLGVLNDDGTLTLNGRAKEMFIRGGYNIYPIEVEAALQAHPDVSLVAVVGVPDPVMGERGVAYIVARDPSNPPDDVREFLKGKIADYKIPDTIEFRDSLPLTPMFKVNKQALNS
ncbi:MAG: class I adenylate-forming enzyme family protein [Actinomycetota bacterium]